MTHDPWSHHPTLSCPECHVLGHVVRCEDDEWSDDVEPYVCVDCGHAFADVGMVGDVKEYRVQYMRLVEGRPYEPPKPKERDPNARSLDTETFDGILKGLYGPEWFEERIVQLAALKCTMPRIIADPHCPPGVVFAVSEGAKVEVDACTGSVTKVEGIAKWTSLGDWMDRAAKLGEDDTE